MPTKVKVEKGVKVHKVTFTFTSETMYESFIQDLCNSNRPALQRLGEISWQADEAAEDKNGVYVGKSDG